MSCLFNSLMYFIHGENSFQIRQKICNYLQENKPIIEGMQTHDVLKFDNRNADEYIRQMRMPSTWGGAIEIQAACNIWHFSVHVLNCRDQNNKHIEFLPINKSYERIIHIYWTGGHYEPIKNM